MRIVEGLEFKDINEISVYVKTLIQSYPLNAVLLPEHFMFMNKLFTQHPLYKTKSAGGVLGMIVRKDAPSIKVNRERRLQIQRSDNVPTYFYPSECYENLFKFTQLFS